MKKSANKPTWISIEKKSVLQNEMKKLIQNKKELQKILQSAGCYKPGGCTGRCSSFAQP